MTLHRAPIDAKGGCDFRIRLLGLEHGLHLGDEFRGDLGAVALGDPHLFRGAPVGPRPGQRDAAHGVDPHCGLHQLQKLLHVRQAKPCAKPFQLLPRSLMFACGRLLKRREFRPQRANLGCCILHSPVVIPGMATY